MQSFTVLFNESIWCQSRDQLFAALRERAPELVLQPVPRGADETLPSLFKIETTLSEWDFQERLQAALVRNPPSRFMVLSSQHYTAQEFEAVARKVGFQGPDAIRSPSTFVIANVRYRPNENGATPAAT